MPIYKRVRVPVCVENAFYGAMVPSSEPGSNVQYSYVLGLCAETIGPRMADPGIAAVAETLIAECDTAGRKPLFAQTYERFFDDARFEVFQSADKSKARAFVFMMAYVAVAVRWPWSTQQHHQESVARFEGDLREESATLADAFLAFQAAYAAA
jgi:hypothetical protein